MIKYVKRQVFQKSIQEFSSLVQITTLSCFKENFSLFNSSVGRARQSNPLIVLFHLQTFLWIWIRHVDLLLFTGNSGNNFLLFLCNRPLVFAFEKFLTERVILKKTCLQYEGRDTLFKKADWVCGMAGVSFAASVGCEPTSIKKLKLFDNVMLNYYISFFNTCYQSFKAEWLFGGKRRLNSTCNKA